MAPPATKFDYQAYLASREWSLLREQVRERSKNICEHCFLAPQQAVHHLTYARIGREELSDLMAICNPCHEFLSGKTSENPADWYTVSPAMELPVMGTFRHLLIPRPWNGLERGKYRIRDRWCREGCVWCSRVEVDWILYIDEFVLQEQNWSQE